MSSLNKKQRIQPIFEEHNFFTDISLEDLEFYDDLYRKCPYFYHYYDDFDIIEAKSLEEFITLYRRILNNYKNHTHDEIYSLANYRFWKYDTVDDYYNAMWDWEDWNQRVRLAVREFKEQQNLEAWKKRFKKSKHKEEN